MKKLLLTGASGFLGYHLMRVASGRWEIYGLTHLKEFDFTGATSIKCDITNYIKLGNYIEDIEPDAVIHTAAISDANFCQQHKELSYLLNVEATGNLAGICCDYNIPFAFTSTDLVFDGTKGMYTEEDKPNPINTYGEQKAMAEEKVLKIYPGATIFRLPLMFGYPQASASNYLQKFLLQIKNGEGVTLFTDEYRSIAGAKSISRGILQLFEETSGILHLAGTEKLSRYDFGMQVVKIFHVPSAGIKACSQKEIKMAAPRPADVSLDISRAVQMGYSPLTVREELELISSNNYF